MAQILTTQFPEQTPAGAPANDYQRIQSSPGMFGGFQAEALRDLGGGIQKAGDEGIASVNAYNEKINAVAAAEQNTFFGDQLTDMHAKFINLRGKAAVDALPEYRQQVDDLRKGILENASSLGMKAHLATSLSRRQEQFYHYWATHAGAQAAQYELDVSKSSAGSEAAQFVIALQQNDEAVARDHLFNMGQQWRNYYETHHYSPDEIETKVKQHTGVAVEQAVKDFVQAGQIGKAREIFDRFGEAGDKEATARLSGALLRAENHLEGEAKADAAIGYSPGKGIVGANLMRGPPDKTALVSITAGDKSLTVHSSVAPQFKGFIDELAAAGAPIRDIGSYNDRLIRGTNTLSQHAYGNAIDINQSDRNQVSKDFKNWAEAHPQELRAAINRWGMISGGDWRSPDFGHFEAGRAFGPDELATAQAGGMPPPNRPAMASFTEAWNTIQRETEGNPVQRAAAESRLTHIHSAYRVDAAAANTAFNQRYKDTVAEAYNTGSASNPMTREEFTAAGRPPGQFEDYQNELTLARDMNGLVTLTPDKMQDLYEGYTPKPGPGYAESAKRQDQLEKAIGAVNEARKHPADFAVNKLPGARDAWNTFKTSLTDKNTTPEAQQDAARKFAETTLNDQASVDIPVPSRAILPKGYVDAINKQFTKAADSDDPTTRIGLMDTVRNEAKMWGEYWPTVMGQLAPTTQPIVRAIAAGAEPEAIMRLLNLGKDENPAKLLKEQNETKFHDLTTNLNDAMAPLRRTMVGRQIDRDFDPYYGLAEKLAALYVRDGQSASDAAIKAFNALVGNRTEFRDTWRMPKSAGVSADDVQKGTVAARETMRRAAENNTEAFGIVPFADNMGIGDTNRFDSLSHFSRDGRFVTSPRNDGLNLVIDRRAEDSYKGPLTVRTSAGVPLLLTWEQLATLGRNREKPTLVAPAL